MDKTTEHKNLENKRNHATKFMQDLNGGINMDETTVFENLERNIIFNRNHVILDVAGRKVTSGEFLENIAKSSKIINSLWVDKNQPITVVDNTTESFLNTFYASNRYGSIFATPGYSIFADGPKHFTGDIGSEVLFISQKFYEGLEANPKTRGIIEKVGLKHIVLFPSDTRLNAVCDIFDNGLKLYDGIEYHDYSVLMERDFGKRDIDINLDGGKNDFAYLFTSGSTGKPKTLRMSNSSFLGMCEKIDAENYGFNPKKDKFFAPLPCNFVTPLETLNYFLQAQVPAYIDPLVDFTKIAELYYKSGTTIVLCPPSLLDPMYIMITQKPTEKLKFIYEMIKNKPKDHKSTKEETLAQLNMIKKMFEKRPEVKWVFSAGEPLPKRLEDSYKRSNINILNCTGAGETGPTAINGKPLKGDVFRILNPHTLNVIYRSDEPNTDVVVRGLEESIESSSMFNGYLNNDELTNSCYNVTENGERFWRYLDIAEVRNGIKQTLCRATDAIFKENKIITPQDINVVVLEDKRILKCESYPVTIDEEDRMVVDIVIRESDREKFKEIVTRANNALSSLGDEYVPFGYKDNKAFGSNPYTAKLDRDAIRSKKTGYINPIDFSEIDITGEYKTADRVLSLYKE